LGRPIRIEYPGAFYHVFSRGNQKQPIFFSDEDRCYFIDCLRLACKKYGVVVHAYCLMPNHFHLFLETALANLSEMMQYLITNYVLYFNKKHARCGHLFQSRFRSVLIDAESYAKELSRYIHLNPVRSGMVERPELYAWSSYGYYLGRADPEGWLETAAVLSLFRGQRREAQKAYAEFIEDGIGKDIVAPIRESVKHGILGDQEFIEKIKTEQLGDDLRTPDREKPQLHELRKKPDLQRIKAICEKALGAGNRWTMPVAILIGHRCTAARLKDLGELYSLSVSGASNACSRAREAIDQSEALSRAVCEIEKEIEAD
jgi:REP-associated tyrosine transposase